MHREGHIASLEAPELEAVLRENPMYGILDFLGGTGNRAIADLYRHEAGNG